MYLYRMFLFRSGSIVGREDFRAPDHDAAIRIGRSLLGACPGDCEYFDLWQDKRRIPIERCSQGAPLYEAPADFRELVIAMARRIRHRSSRAA